MYCRGSVAVSFATGLVYFAQQRDSLVTLDCLVPLVPPGGRRNPCRELGVTCGGSNPPSLCLTFLHPVSAARKTTWHPQAPLVWYSQASDYSSSSSSGTLRTWSKVGKQGTVVYHTSITHPFNKKSTHFPRDGWKHRGKLTLARWRDQATTLRREEPRRRVQPTPAPTQHDVL